MQKSGSVRISSWEIGVLVWPGLYKSDASMVGSFKEDRPSIAPGLDDDRAVVGLRIPYSLPLQRYGTSEVPWVVSMNHTEPDNRGERWIVE